MEFQAEDPNHLLSYQRQIKQKELVELYHTGNVFKSVKSSVPTTAWGLSDPASCKDSAASEHCSYKAFLFTSYAFYSSPLIQEFMALRVYLWKSIFAMATVSCSKFWINAGIVQLLAFPSLRGATCFYLAQKMKGKPRAAGSGRRLSTFCWAGQIPQALQGWEVGSQVTQPTELLYPHTIVIAGS